MRFSIVTPFGGPLVWLMECIQSAYNEKYQIDHYVYLDNFAFTYPSLLSWTRHFKGAKNLCIRLNTINQGAMKNHWDILQEIKKKDLCTHDNIIIHLDGDDILFPWALNEIYDAYRNDDVWATYGNYLSKEGSVCKPMNEITFRERILHGGWCFSHPRTFRAHLIPFLKKEDMLDTAGNWFSAAADVAIFCPILEMCGKEKVKFIDKELLYYRIHENNDHSPNRLQNQIRCAIEIYNKKPYTQI